MIQFILYMRVIKPMYHWSERNGASRRYASVRCVLPFNSRSCRSVSTNPNALYLKLRLLNEKVGWALRLLAQLHSQTFLTADLQNLASETTEQWHALAPLLCSYWCCAIQVSQKPRPV